MSNKLEYKFLVPLDTIDSIRQTIMPYVEFDTYTKRRKEKRYTVRSIYYDTRTFDCYEEKVEGFLEKKKFRIRSYNSLKECDTVFFEIKRKLYDFIEKDRSCFKWKQTLNLFTASTPELMKILSCSGDKNETAARHFFYYYLNRHLLPVILIIYEREAFYSKFDKSLRLTIDQNLRSRLFPTLDMLYAESDFKYALPHTAILEVKFYRGLPCWIQSLIQQHNLQRLAVSKYAICLDSHPEAYNFIHKFAYVPERLLLHQ
ncbi:MAG: polyphosphate polymerase domain-containing protein [candidate division WOR-3 bacterium]